MYRFGGKSVEWGWGPGTHHAFQPSPPCADNDHGTRRRPYRSVGSNPAGRPPCPDPGAQGVASGRGSLAGYEA